MIGEMKGCRDELRLEGYEELMIAQKKRKFRMNGRLRLMEDFK